MVSNLFQNHFERNSNLRSKYLFTQAKKRLLAYHIEEIVPLISLDEQGTLIMSTFRESILRILLASADIWPFDTIEYHVIGV